MSRFEAVLVLHVSLCWRVFSKFYWKKANPVERDCFSDEEDSETDSEYEQISIPKKKKAAKRKRKVSKAADSKRAKPQPK